MPRIPFLSLWAGKMGHVPLKSAQSRASDLTSCLDPEGSSRAAAVGAAQAGSEASRACPQPREGVTARASLGSRH